MNYCTRCGNRCHGSMCEPCAGEIEPPEWDDDTPSGPCDWCGGPTYGVSDLCEQCDWHARQDRRPAPASPYAPAVKADGTDAGNPPSANDPGE